jgi:hypothetical protein
MRPELYDIKLDGKGDAVVDNCCQECIGKIMDGPFDRNSKATEAY